ncbi:MAG: hypothetical protein MK180_04635 [Rhodobacteraceae bacterium]|nr:hypothetical protein [Paracoccaceae bacterium]
MYRIALMFALALGLAACSETSLDERPDPIGDFRLGFLVPVTSENLTKGPVSREATPEEWKAAMETAFRPRFERYEGSSFYHLGVIVEGYVLAQPGVPVVLAPKSALIFSVTVIEDATQMQLTAEPKQFTVLEDFSATSIVGSGLVLSKEQQMANLADNAAVRVENWLRDQPWFYDEAGEAAADPEPLQ